MMQLPKLIACVFGIGYIKGGGTIASLITCIIWYFIPAGSFDNYRQLYLTALICVVGTWSSNKVDSFWGKDSNKVVIDEVAGMILTLIFFPVQLSYLITGLLLFRFFDIVKPFGIRKMEALPKGFGVMADDVLAGIYAHITLWIFMQTGLLDKLF